MRFGSQKSNCIRFCFESVAKKHQPFDPMCLLIFMRAWDSDGIETPVIFFIIVVIINYDRIILTVLSKLQIKKWVIEGNLLRGSWIFCFRR